MPLAQEQGPVARIWKQAEMNLLFPQNGETFLAI